MTKGQKIARCAISTQQLSLKQLVSCELVQPLASYWRDHLHVGRPLIYLYFETFFEHNESCFRVSLELQTMHMFITIQGRIESVQSSVSVFWLYMLCNLLRYSVVS